MSAPANLCPQCHSERMVLKEGMLHCPKCGFDGEEKKPGVDSRPRHSNASFWLVLFTPAAGALLSYSLGRFLDLRGGGMAIGFIDFLLGIVTSIYCGIWLARRFCHSEDFRILIAFLFILGIGFVNLVIIFAGCSPNINFH